MPFGTVGKGEYGTYFIGYARSPSRTELMLDNMFSGDPPGNYDRLLDFSTLVTGSLFFLPHGDISRRSDLRGRTRCRTRASKQRNAWSGADTAAGLTAHSSSDL